MKKILISLLFLFGFLSAQAQTTVSSTTLSVAVTNTGGSSGGQLFTVASATGITPSLSAPLYGFVDGELVNIKFVNSTTLTVERGVDGTSPRTHLSGAPFYFGPPNVFTHSAQSGSCTAANTFNPTFNTRTGDKFSCIAGFWQKLVDNTFTFPQSAYTTTSYTNATTSFTSVPNLAFPVDAGKNYSITCRITWQGSAATTGPKYQFTGPASPTAVTANALSAVTATTVTQTSATAFATSMPNAGTVTTATNFMDEVRIFVLNGVNAGTVQLQAAANGAGTLTIATGSSCQLIGQ